MMCFVNGCQPFYIEIISNNGAINILYIKSVKNTLSIFCMCDMLFMVETIKGRRRVFYESSYAWK